MTTEKLDLIVLVSEAVKSNGWGCLALGADPCRYIGTVTHHGPSRGDVTRTEPCDRHKIVEALAGFDVASLVSIADDLAEASGMIITQGAQLALYANAMSALRTTKTREKAWAIVDELTESLNAVQA